jgi:hypothetical protein
MTFQIAARNVGQQVDIPNASTIREIDAAFARLAQMRVDALLVAADPIFFNRASQLVVLATRHAIPALYSRREFVAAGGPSQIPALQRALTRSSTRRYAVRDSVASGNGCNPASDRSVNTLGDVST